MPYSFQPIDGAEIGLSEDRVPYHGFSQVCPGEVRPAEVYLEEVRLAEVRLAEVWFCMRVFPSPAIPRPDPLPQDRQVLLDRHHALRPISPPTAHPASAEIPRA